MKKLFYSFLVFFMFLSCSEHKGLEPVAERQDVDTNFVEMREAVVLAEMMEFSVTEANGLKAAKQKKVKNSKAMGNDPEKPSYYVINYADSGGFVIIAGDRRADLVLAYSEENGFDTEAGSMPDGLLNWMSSADEYVQDIREKNEQVDGKRLKAQLCTALKSAIDKPLITDPDCFETDPPGGCPAEYQTITTVGPLLTTLWHQGEGFNDLVPLNCGSVQALAGCVAIAVAQVMYYHKYPASYKWDTMNRVGGMGDAPRLIRDLGIPANLDMDYGCGDSSANTSNIPRTFKNFGYSNSGTVASGINYQTIKTQLKANMPVILVGFTNAGKGHAWVCDGYRQQEKCTYTLLHLHMNWGWYEWNYPDCKYNGWYASGVYQANYSDSNYNKNQTMVYNIKP